MGKKKNKKFGAPKPQPTGLPSVNDNGDEEDELMQTNSSPAVVSDVLDQLQSAEESARECGCGTLAALATQPGAVPILLASNVVRILAPLVIDPSPSVRHRALGALRNMTVDGGLDVCHEMVLKDVLTPLVALFKQYGANWQPEKADTKHTDTQLDTFLQAVHILWNLCEASDIAVTVFNNENLLPVLLPCLQHSVYGFPLATAVAQCLQTVTEGNCQAAALCQRADILQELKGVSDTTNSSSQAMLFSISVMGILQNVLGEDLMMSATLSPLVNLLSQILDIQVTTLIAQYASNKTQENGVQEMGATASGDSDSDTPCLMDEEVTPTDAAYTDLVNTLDAQRLCLELITNMSCSTGEEEWEEIDSSESGSADEMTEGGAGCSMDEDILTDNNNFDPVCAPSEVHAAFTTNNIMAKVLRVSMPLPPELETEMKCKKWGKRIANKVMKSRTHALLCVNNLMEVLPLDALGGREALHHLWDTLALQVKATDAPSGASSPASQSTNADLLEATTSAMRATIQKLAQLDSPKFSEVTVADVHFMAKLAEGAASSVQMHVMRIIATMALMFVKTSPVHPVIQEVGGCLVLAATHSPDLVVVAEALDAIFDVFADDATDPVAQNLQLTDKLRVIMPQLKPRLQSQKKSLGGNYVTVATSRTNLIRFLKYKESQAKR